MMKADRLLRRSRDFNTVITPTSKRIQLFGKFHQHHIVNHLGIALFRE
jgi:hypothetical protein